MTVNKTKPRLNVYERPDATWGWRLYGDNGSDIIATDGNQGYTSKSECQEMGEKVISGHYADEPVTNSALPKTNG